MGTIITFDDFWGRETGTRSAYERAYAARQNFYSGMMESTTSPKHNFGNDFIRFEKERAAILKTQYKDMLVNLFRYDNVPPSFNVARLEILLRSFGGGICVGLDKQGDLVVLGRADELGLNCYGGILPASFSEGSEYLSDKRIITPRNLKGDYVMFFNKQSSIDFFSNDYALIDHFVDYMATIKATERMNILQMRSPYIVKTVKDGINGEELQGKLMDGDLFLEIDEAVDVNSKISKLDLPVRDITPTTTNIYRIEGNNMLTLLGLYNNPEAKKERMVDKEASANNHIVEAMGDIYLNARRGSLDLLNNAFGTNITVQWNSTVASAFREMVYQNAQQRGGF